MDIQIYILRVTSQVFLCSDISIYKIYQNYPGTNYFFTNNDIRNSNTRNSSLLHKKCSRTNYAKHTLANKGIEVWNNLSEQYKKPRSYDSFENNYQKLLLTVRLIYVQHVIFMSFGTPQSCHLYLQSFFDCKVYKLN